MAYTDDEMKKAREQMARAIERIHFYNWLTALFSGIAIGLCIATWIVKYMRG